MNGLRTSKSPPQPALRARVAHAPAWKKTLQVEAFVFDLSLKLIGLEQSSNSPVSNTVKKKVRTI